MSPIDKTVHKAIRDLIRALHDLYGSGAPAVVLYGSQARGEARPESDVDILLLFDDPVLPGREIRRISPILADLNLRYGVLISILPATEDEYRTDSSPFWLNLRRDGVRVGVVESSAG